MPVLGTTMLSAMMSADSVQKVANWILDQPSRESFTVAVCQAEIPSGIAILPSNRRRTNLTAVDRVTAA